MKMSLKSKLIFGGVVASMLPLVIIGYFAVSRTTYALVKNAEFQSVQVSKDLVVLAEEIVSQEKIYAASISQVPVVTSAVSKMFDSNSDSTKQELRALKKFLGAIFEKCEGRYEKILVTDQNGKVIANNTTEDTRIDLGDREYFKRAKDGQVNLSEPIISKLSGVPVISLAAPLKTPTGQFCAAIVFVIKLDRLSDKIVSVKLGETGYPFMVDKKGMVISHPNSGLIFKANMTQMKGMEKITNRIMTLETGVEAYEFKGVKKIAGFAPVKYTDWSILVTQDEKDFLAAPRAIQRTILIVGIVFLIIVIFGVLWFVKGIMAQLGGEPAEIAGIAHGIADGDLTITFRENGRKLTGVYAGMKEMTRNLSVMISEITSGIQTLTSSSTELSSISEQMASNAENTSDKANSVATASEEMTTNMNGVAAATEQTSSNIQMIVAAAEEMSSTISEIASNMAKGSQTTMDAVNKAEEVSKRVHALGEAATQISNVTETIADISEQTNLLALNATIEAARAGEAGKGFAVVAGEIKALAQQTAEATKEIGVRISEVQATTENSVSAIESILSVINEINSIVTSVTAAIEEQSATTQEIVNNVSQAGLGVQEVNENVNQASLVAGEVSKNIHHVSQASEEIKSGSLLLNESAVELSNLAENLNQLVARFILE